MPALLTDREFDDEIGETWKEIRDRHAVTDEDEAPPAKDGEQRADGEVDDGAAEEPQAREQRPGTAERPAAAADDKGAAADQPRDQKSGRYKPAPKAAKGKQPQQQATSEETPPAARAAQPRTNERQGERAGEQPAAAQPQQRDLTRAPSTWSPKERAAWANVPQEARAAIHRRESDFMAGQSQLLPDAQFGAEMRATIDPYRMLIDSEGGTPATAILDLLKTAAILRTGTAQQKYGTIANIASRFGLDLRLFGARPTNGQQQPQSVPPQHEFRDPRVDGLIQHFTTQEQQRAAAEQRTAESTVARWMNEADAAGNPLRPYAADVIDAMSVMIPQIKSANPNLSYDHILGAAYEAATWANPEIRQLLQTQQRTANDAQARAESQRRAEAARRGASVNVPRRGAAPRRPQTGSMEDTIAETARELGLIGS